MPPGALWLAEEQEPWLLATNLPRLQAKTISRIYGRRMTIEQSFRDTKSEQNGFALRLTLIREPRRLERMLLVLALAYWLLVAVGLAASKSYGSVAWCSNNRPGECSLFMIGRIMIARLPLRPRPIFNALRSEVLQGNWG